MPEIATTQPAGYDPVAKTLHWLVLGLLVLQFALAWTMPEIEADTRPETLINLHLSVGAVILPVAVIRLLWRLAHPVAPIADNLPDWQNWAASTVHWLLYVLLLALPLLGWANASARGWTVELFGSIALPKIMAEGSAIGHAAGDLHALMATALLGLTGLHVAAALYHHFWLKDRVLLRMLPGSR